MLIQKEFTSSIAVKFNLSQQSRNHQSCKNENKTILRYMFRLPQWIYEGALTHSEQRPQNISSQDEKKKTLLSWNSQHKFLNFHYKSVKLNVLCRH